MLTIGEFARLTHLSVRTLRRYHEAGLLEPSAVDGVTGYRYYGADQIPTAQVVHRLRELDVPLADVQRILSSDDPTVRAALVSEHLRRLEAELDRTRAAVVSLRRLLLPEVVDLDVELRAVPARTVAAVEDDVDHDGILGWYTGAAAELEAVVTDPTGAPGGVYDNSLFEHGRGHALVYRPTDRPARAGRVHPVTLPAVELAVTTHLGAHDDIDVTYGQLGAWVVENTLVVAGPVREVYAVGPRDTPDPAAWRTEIGWPVFRVGTPGAAVADGRDREKERALVLALGDGLEVAPPADDLGGEFAPELPEVLDDGDAPSEGVSVLSVDADDPRATADGAVVLPVPGDMCVLLVRTDYSDDDAWQRVLAAATAVYDVGDFPRRGACLEPVEAPGLTGATPDQLVALPRAGDISVLAVADSRTMQDLTVQFVDLNEDNDQIGRTFRAARELVEPIVVNLTLANADFFEYADGADPDGVVRHF